MNGMVINHYGHPRNALKGRKGKRNNCQKVQNQEEIFHRPL